MKRRHPGRGPRVARSPPELRTVDRAGRRLDVVGFHPAYHQLMATAFVAGVHALPWATRHPCGHSPVMLTTVKLAFSASTIRYLSTGSVRRRRRRFFQKRSVQT